MPTTAYTMFDTAIGRCAVSWGDAGITGVWLPASTPEATERQVRRRLPDVTVADPPPEVSVAIDAMRRLLAGDDVDLRDVRLDMTGVPDFDQQVYAAARALPCGVTKTYGEIATGIGAAGAAQAVGRALGHNPFPIVVPCHRVVAAGGRNGGFSAPGGVDTKLRMLAIEGAALF